MLRALSCLNRILTLWPGGSPCGQRHAVARIFLAASATC